MSKVDPGSETSGRRKRRTPIEECLHAVPDHLCGLVIGKDGHAIREIKTISGASVYKTTQPTSIPGMSIFVIRGSRTQIMEAIRLICQKSGTKETISAYAQAFWEQWVKDMFPSLESKAYFLPAVFVKRVPVVAHHVAGQHVLVPRQPRPQDEALNAHATPPSFNGRALTPRPLPVQETDLSDDSALERVLSCFSKMAEEYGDVFVAVSQLKFGDYLAEPSYTAAAALLPSPSNLPPCFPRNYNQGDFDILIIHKRYGFIVCEVKSSGYNLDRMGISDKAINAQIQDKLRKASKQLDKAQAVLSHLVSDICPGLRVTKVVALPNLTKGMVMKAIAADPQGIQDLHHLLGATEPSQIGEIFLCSDHLPDPGAPWDIEDETLKEFRRWWERIVRSVGPDCQMLPSMYRTLVARFCGPATTVTVPCIISPRLALKTLSQAVSVTGECYTAQITLFPEQVNLLNSELPLVFISGPPGTGKTVVLLLMAIKWLQEGHHVYIVGSCHESLTACRMLVFLVRQRICQQLAGAADRLHLVEYSLETGPELAKAIGDMNTRKKDGALHIIADEAGPDDRWRTAPHFRTFCENLLATNPSLHLWAASCYNTVAPAGWQVHVFTRPLRNPPVVTREVEMSDEIGHDVTKYTELPVPAPTDGPSVKRIFHQGAGHSAPSPGGCKLCGRQVRDFLHSLRVGSKTQFLTPDIAATSVKTVVYRRPCDIPDISNPPDLEYRDVLVLCVGSAKDNKKFIGGMKKGLPVRVVEKDADVTDVATASSDVVWVTCGSSVRGLERKVVVCVRNEQRPTDKYNRLYAVSRCVSQLVLVAPSPVRARSNSFS